MNVVICLVVTGMLVIIYPESPKYYYMMGRYTRARKILKEISLVYNKEVTKGTNPVIAIFKEEAHDHNIDLSVDYLEQDASRDSKLP